MMDMVPVLFKKHQKSVGFIVNLITMDPVENGGPGRETVIDGMPEEWNEEGVPEMVDLDAGVEVLDGEKRAKNDK